MSKNNTKLNSVNEQVSLKEHLSALIDGEAGSFEQRRVLDELKSDDNLSKNLSRYAFIGEAMRSKTTAVAGDSFLAGIHEQIKAEPSYHDVQIEEQSKSKAKNESSWLKPIGGLALAASVAAVTLLGVQNYTQTSNSSSDMIASAPVLKDEFKNSQSIESKTAAATNTASGTDYRQANAHARSFLKRFVDSHMQYASTSTFVPSVRVIAYADYK